MNESIKAKNMKYETFPKVLCMLKFLYLISNGCVIRSVIHKEAIAAWICVKTSIVPTNSGDNTK